MRSKYFSRRALAAHFALVAWLTMCILADWWQVGRAFGGNSLSFLYAIEWPCFAVLGFFGWWQILHVERPTENQEAARREFEQRMREEAALARIAGKSDEDSQLAAYNDHLSELSIVPKKKLWGH